MSAGSHAASRVARACAVAVAIASLARPALGQHDAPRPRWVDRVAVSAQWAVFDPTGDSEAFALIDRALAPGASALRPKLAGGALHVRVVRQWHVVLGAEAGGTTLASVSRARPATAAADVRQQTSLDLTSVRHLGAEWTGLRWRGADARADDRLRVVLGAGAGVARYRLRQWGDFVDAARGVAYADDFRSTGRGTFGYAAAGVELPLRRWVALRGDARRQFGAAPMSADFSTFDRLDLGGTRLGLGVLLRPGAARTR